MVETGENQEQSQTPSILTEVVYKYPGIAKFPMFDREGVLHGFAWGKGIPSSAFRLAKSEAEKDVITAYIRNFLARVGMEGLDRSYTIEAIGEDICDITEDLDEVFAKEDNAKYIPYQAAFTTRQGIPILGKPGDCLFSMVSAKTRSGKPIVGLVHTGRWQLTQQFSRSAIEHLVRVYGASREDIKICITPGLGKEHHTLHPGELTEQMYGNEIDAWGKNLRLDPSSQLYHFDGISYLVQQYLYAGVLAENIQGYEVDTFSAALAGESFSHRATVMTKGERKDGRFLVAVSL